MTAQRPHPTALAERSSVLPSLGGETELPRSLRNQLIRYLKVRRFFLNSACTR